MFTEDKILDISKNHEYYLMSLENVVGIGLGYKFINKINTLEPCIHVLVEKKVNAKNLSTNNIIPKTYMGIKTDVIETGKFCAYSPKFSIPSRIRPLQGGFSISPDVEGETGGTISCIVTRKLKGERIFYILSNNHVLAGVNKIPNGTPILQPGKINNGNLKNDVVAYLSYCTPIVLQSESKSSFNYVDCAVAKVATRRFISNEIFKVGTIKGVSIPKPDAYVKKVGMASGKTEGIITTIGGTVFVSYKTGNAKFKNQITANLLSKPGDSGSLVLNKYNEAVGLLFTGGKSSTGYYSNFSDIRMVLDALEVSIYIG